MQMITQVLLIVLGVVHANVTSPVTPNTPKTTAAPPEEPAASKNGILITALLLPVVLIGGAAIYKGKFGDWCCQKQPVTSNAAQTDGDAAAEINATTEEVCKTTADGKASATDYNVSASEWNQTKSDSQATFGQCDNCSIRIV